MSGWRRCDAVEMGRKRSFTPRTHLVDLVEQLSGRETAQDLCTSRSAERTIAPCPPLRISEGCGEHQEAAILSEMTGSAQSIFIAAV